MKKSFVTLGPGLESAAFDLNIKSVSLNFLHAVLKVNI